MRFFTYCMCTFLDLFIRILCMCLHICVCASPLSCQCIWRLSNRISAARRRFMPTLGLLIRRSLTDSHAWQTASSTAEKERGKEGKRGETNWRWADGESERQTEKRRRWIKGRGEVRNRKWRKKCGPKMLRMREEGKDRMMDRKKKVRVL